ncbi:alpha/beta hydrolase [Streptomyces kaniharaensis]|uniref:Alpha/beta hydrolase n=1 Tax=Streptomyces kaniharaensis TaxID=212423 RepID=A0A6N7KP02_9ACTN|nr:alpha/beta hydrolase [Streptomyces kaniharaensis]MQS11353.1 alpha/beta hydrolase [Streptomyces kaniharaensis]
MFRAQRGRTAQLTQRQGEGEVRGVALLLPGGFVRGRGGPVKVAELGLRDLATELTERGHTHGIAVHLLRYRHSGWNGPDADTAVDTRWALDELARRYGPVPVVLVGNSLGGRAAFWCAGHPNVTGVAGIAPWLPSGDPVEQLAGRRVLIVHGTGDHSAAGATQSLEYALRARTVVPDLARYEVPGGSHYLVRQAADISALTTAFTLATLGAEPSAFAEGTVCTRLPSRV